MKYIFCFNLQVKKKYFPNITPKGEKTQSSIFSIKNTNKVRC